MDARRNFRRGGGGGGQAQTKALYKDKKIACMEKEE